MAWCVLKVVVYYKWRPIASRLLHVVAESIRCLSQETEQVEVCSPEFNLKYICICAKTTLIALET